MPYYIHEGTPEFLTDEQATVDVQAVGDFESLCAFVMEGGNPNDAVALVERLRAAIPLLPPLRASYWTAELARIGVKSPAPKPPKASKTPVARPADDL